MQKSHLALVVPTTVFGTVADRGWPPRRKRNAESRTREYLTDGAVARLINTAVRNGLRAGDHERTRCTTTPGFRKMVARLGVARLASTFQFIRTCSGMPVATSSPMTASIPARCRAYLGHKNISGADPLHFWRD
jgi:hypothetical protein